MTTSTVITGDIIKSRRSNPARFEHAMTALRDGADKLSEALGVPVLFDRYRGDGWQIHVPQAHAALCAAIFMHASLRSATPDIKSRLSIGIGTTTSLGQGDLSAASGTAFEEAGQGLDDIGRNWLVIRGAGVGPDQRAIVALVAHIADGWTAAQAQAIALAISDPDATQEMIAAQIGVTRQAVQLRLAAAGNSALHAAFNAFRKHPFQDDNAL